MREPFFHPVTKPLAGPKERTERYSVQASHSARHRHLLRLHDILQHLVSLPPSHANSVQSLRAWRALARCREVDLKALYQLGGKILARTREAAGVVDQDSREEQEWRQGRRADWLKWCREGRHGQVEKLTEYTLCLVAAGRHQSALDELETYLPAYPYNDSITLNVLAGHLCLLIGQPGDRKSSESGDDDDLSDSDADSDDSSSASSDAVPVKRDVAVVSDGTPLAANDYSPLLKMLSQYAPSRISQAAEHYRRASRLERKSPELSFGEGARWLHILESSDATRNLTGKRALHDSDSDSDDDE